MYMEARFRSFWTIRKIVALILMTTFAFAIRAATVCGHSSAKQSIINSTKVKLFPLASIFLYLPLSHTFPPVPIPRITNTRSDTHRVQWSGTHLATQPVNLMLLCGLAAGRHRLCPVFLPVLMWGYTQGSVWSCRARAVKIQETEGKKGGEGTTKGEPQWDGRDLSSSFSVPAAINTCEKCWLWLLLWKLKRFQLLLLWAMDKQSSHRYQDHAVAHVELLWKN